MKMLTVALVIIMGVVMLGFSGTIIHDWKCPGKPTSISTTTRNRSFSSASALFLLPTALLDFFSDQADRGFLFS